MVCEGSEQATVDRVLEVLKIMSIKLFSYKNSGICDVLKYLL
jgi:hypothetical protein